MTAIFFFILEQELVIFTGNSRNLIENCMSKGQIIWENT